MILIRENWIAVIFCGTARNEYGSNFDSRVTKFKRSAGMKWAEEITLVIIVLNDQQWNGETKTRGLVILTYLIKRFFNHYKDDNIRK